MRTHPVVRRLAVAGTMAFILLLTATGAAWARSGSVIVRPTLKPQLSDSNPAFVIWQATRHLQAVFLAASPHGLGQVPDPQPPLTSNGKPSGGPELLGYAASFDLRTQVPAKLTAVRNQGSWGTCWSFATYGALESELLPGETADFSEDNLVLNSGFDTGATASAKYNYGGNLTMSTAYLTRWDGPVYETDDAYGDQATPAGLTSRKHVQDISWFAPRANATDNDRIKYALTTYGGVMASMSWQGSTNSTSTYYNATTRAYYYDGTSGTNHAVVIVGWDDDYAASNFSTTPPGNGAFIVRNSWGSGWGSSGYFYLSYYDSQFARTSNCATFEGVQSANNYEAVYQYDPLGSTASIGYGGTTAWMANTFTSTSAQMLKAVGFYALAANTSYEVYEGPSRSQLTLLTSGTLPQAGFHTVAVPAGTTWTSGATFCVAVKVTSPGSTAPIALERPVPGYASTTAAAGQSYMSSSGTSWTDVGSAYANTNVCLKAYASAVSAAPTSTSAYGFSADATSGWKTAAQTVTISASGGSGTGRTIHYSQDGGSSWSTTTAASVDVSVSTQGAHHIEYYASDSLGTESTHDAGWVNVDSVAPSTSDNHLSVSLVNSATITLTPSDATSGMSGGSAKTEYKVDGASTYTSGTTVTLSNLGAHTVAYRSIDRAGNVETPDKTFTVTVRAPVAPTSSTTFTSFAASATSGWQSSAQQVTITASGGDGAGRTIYYSQDGGTTWGTSTAASVNVSVAGQGAHDFRYYCKDSLATEATHTPGWINIDSVAPATTDDHLTVSLIAPATVSLAPSDAASGVKWSQYKVDGAPSYSTGTSVVLATPGSHTVAYRSVDNAGNVEAPDKTFTVTVTAQSVTAPSSATTFTGFAADAASGWKTSGQTVHLTASGGSGTGRTIHYSQDGGATWSTAAADAVEVSVSSQGSHHIEYYASDSLATEATHDAGWINVDSVAPSTTDDHPASGAAPLAVTLTASDVTSGMSGGSARTEYKVDGAGAYTPGTSVVLGAGEHVVAYRSTDKAGNVESPDKSFTVMVTEPTTPASACGFAFSPDALSGWKNSAQQFTITATGGVGTGRTIHYSLDGGATWSTSSLASVDVPVAGDGAHHVQFYADDSLACEGTHDAGWINIDTGVPSSTSARASVRKGSKVTLRYRVTDPAQGCGKAVLKLQIRKKSKVVRTIALGTKATNATFSYRYRARLQAGTYTWRVLATDLAGNVAVKVTSARLVIR